MEASGERRSRSGEEVDRQGSFHGFGRVENPDARYAGKHSVSRADDAPAGRRSEAEELLRQVAASERKIAVPRDGGNAYHVAAARVFGAHGEGVPPPAGWQAALA